MTFHDWIEATKRRYRTQSLTTATWRSVTELYRGAVRRTVDPYLGRPIWDRGDWDVCIVCDAARVDLFREAIDDYDNLPDSDAVGAVWSNASCSIDWIDRQFNRYPDEARRTGYVTANPFADHDCPKAESASLSEPAVGHLRRLYQTDWQEAQGVMTVPPDVVTDHAIDAWRRRDELGIDRLVVHYMQPHEPYRTRPDWGNGDHALLEDLVDGNEDYAGSSVFPRVRDGDVSVSEFREVYLDNHHWVLEDLAGRLVENIDGTVAITADHGNGLGEYGAWHHPAASIAPPIRQVPWVERECTDTETVMPDITPDDGSDGGHETAERLEALGYL